MPERKDMTPDSDGVLTVTIGDTDHEYRVEADQTVTFSWVEE